MLTFTIYNTLVEIEILTSGFRSRQLHPRWLVQVQENRFRRPSGTEVDDLHEKDPTKAFCTRALKAYDATLSAIGYGLLVKSDLVKSDLMNNRRQCLEDLELVGLIFSCIINIFFLLQTKNEFVL